MNHVILRLVLRLTIFQSVEMKSSNCSNGMGIHNQNQIMAPLHMPPLADDTSSANALYVRLPLQK